MDSIIILTGRLGKDPVKVNTKTGMDMATFSVATDHYDGTKKEKVTSWHNIVCFGSVAKYALYAKKGSSVVVKGSIRYEKYTPQNGQERDITKIIANEVAIINESRKSEESASYGAGDAAKSYDETVPF